MPIAPMKTRSSAGRRRPTLVITPHQSLILAAMSVNRKLPVNRNRSRMPPNMKASPIRVTMKAFVPQ